MRGWETTAALAVVTVVLGVAGWAGCGDDESTKAGGGSPTLGMNDASLTSQMATYVASDEGYYAEEVTDEVDVVTGGYVGGPRKSD